METFKKLKEVRELLGQLSVIKTCKEFDLILEIGFHQASGVPICLKNLLLLNLASAATVRRCLDKLVIEGTVVRHVCTDDRRSVEYTLSESAAHSLKHTLTKVTLLLHR